jgi:hypothetical protein
MEEKQTCCICGCKFTGYGNNPFPLSNTGRCCDECNGKVIEVRIGETTGEIKRRDFRELLNEFYDGKTEVGLYTSTNENNEQIIVEITNEYLKTSVFQGNGWIRINIYHKDHTTEELYER